MSERAVHDAIWARLDDQLSVDVYDHVPDQSAFPFVSIGQHDVDELDSDLVRAGTHRITLTIWSAHRGQQQVLDLMGQIDAALHHYETALSSGALVLMRIDDRRSTLDADGKTYMGSVTIEVIAQR